MFVLKKTSAQPPSPIPDDAGKKTKASTSILYIYICMYVRGYRPFVTRYVYALHIDIGNQILTYLSPKVCI